MNVCTNSTCRICVSREAQTVSIFETPNQCSMSLQDIIMKLANVQVFQGDGLPSCVCYDCKEILEEYNKYRLLVEESDRLLRKNLLKDHDYPQKGYEGMIMNSEHTDKSVEESKVDSNMDLSEEDAVLSRSSDNNLNPELDVPQLSPENCDSNKDMREEMIEPADMKREVKNSYSGEQECSETNQINLNQNENSKQNWSKDNVYSKMKRLLISPNIKLIPTNTGKGNQRLFMVVPKESNKHQIADQQSPPNRLSELLSKFKCDVCNKFMLNERILLDHKKYNHCQENVQVSSSENQSIKEKINTVKSIENNENSLPLEKKELSADSQITLPVPEKDKDEVDYVNLGAECEVNDQSATLEEEEENPVNVSSTDDCQSVIEMEELDIYSNSFMANDTTKIKKNACTLLKSTKPGICSKDQKTKAQKCTICNKILGKNSLRNHMKYVHSANLKYLSCSMCKKKFKHRTGLKRHIEEIHNVRKFSERVECDICNKVMSCRRYLLMHKKSKHSEKKFNCSLCNKVFKHPVNLKRHYKEIHYAGNKDVPCTTCGKVLSSVRQLKSHEKFVHSDFQYVCNVCGKSFKHQASFKRHQTEIHPSEDVRKYPCDICNRSFSNKYLLNHHKKIKFCINTVTKNCEHCGKTFYNDVKLNAHIRRVHTDYLVRVCKLCGANVKNLNNHMKQVHSETKPACCKICGEIFSNFKEMLRHKKTHSDAEHTCNKCGKVLSDKYTLKKHLVSHSVTKYYKCDLCDLSFSYYSSLKAHRQVHSGVPAL